jgi:putative membrane protein
VRPLAMLLSLPLLILTLGLFYFILNALLLWVASAVIPGYTVAGFVPALIGSLVLMIVNWLIGALVKK